MLSSTLRSHGCPTLDDLGATPLFSGRPISPPTGCGPAMALWMACVHPTRNWYTDDTILYRAVIARHPLYIRFNACGNGLQHSTAQQHSIAHHLSLSLFSFFLVNTSFFFLLVFSPPSPLAPLFSLSYHGIFFQQRKHLAPRCPRTASLSSTARSIVIPSNWVYWVWERRRGKLYTAHEPQA